jgi:hypothetical protein
MPRSFALILLAIRIIAEYLLRISLFILDVSFEIMSYAHGNTELEHDYTFSVGKIIVVNTRSYHWNRSIMDHIISYYFHLTHSQAYILYITTFSHTTECRANSQIIQVTDAATAFVTTSTTTYSLFTIALSGHHWRAALLLYITVIRFLITDKHFLNTGRYLFTHWMGKSNAGRQKMPLFQYYAQN